MSRLPIEISLSSSTDSCRLRPKKPVASGHEEGGADDPYSMLCENVVQCSKEDHTRKNNCKLNPWCIYGLDEKDGMWSKKPLLLAALGANPSKSLRRVSASSSTKTPPCGLINLGATCYLNVLIQSLFHNQLIRDAVFNMAPNGSETKEEQRALTEVFLALQKCFVYLQLGDNGVYDLRGFVELLGLNSGVQQDPQEFNKLFFGKIEALNLPLQDNSRADIKGLLNGTEAYCTRCQGCGTEQRADHPFYEIDLNIEGHRSVEAALAGYLQEEELSGDNQYECRKCGGKRDAVRCTQIVAPPSVLYIHLLRYTYDKTTFEKRKLRTDVAYPQVLTFHGEQYALVSVLYHKGSSAYGGHYVCDVLDWDADTWWHCDDSVVSPTTCPALDFADDTASVHSDQREQPQMGDVVDLVDSDEYEPTSSGAAKRKKKAADAAAKKQKTGKEGKSGKGNKEGGSKQEEEGEDGADSPDKPVKYTGRRKDAYMLSYVRMDDFNARHAVPRIAPAPQFISEVEDASAAFRGTIAEYDRERVVVESLIAARKAVWESIEKPTPDLVEGKPSDASAYHLVPSLWLSRWFNGHPLTFTGLPSAITLPKDPLPGFSSHLCEHGTGLNISDIKSFKCLSDEAFLKITTQPDQLQPVDHDFTCLNYRCQNCYDGFLETTSSNNALANSINKLLKRISDAENAASAVNHTRLVAKPWITSLRKKSELLNNALAGTGKKNVKDILACIASGYSADVERAVDESAAGKPAVMEVEEDDKREVYDLCGDDEPNVVNLVGDSNAPSEVFEVFSNPKNRVDPTVNKGLLCEHNALVNCKKAIAVPRETWQMILDLYPYAIEVPKSQEQCKVCLQQSNAQQLSAAQRKQVRADELVDPCLAALCKAKAIVPKEFKDESILEAGGEKGMYCLVDGRWTAKWRHYLKQIDFPRPPRSELLKSLRCDHGLALIPEVLRGIPKGILPHNYHDPKKVQVCSSDDCFDKSELPLAELVTREQFTALSMANDPEQDEEEGNASTKQVFDNRVTLEWKEGGWAWSVDHCQPCLEAAEGRLKTSNTMFDEKKISVKLFTDEDRLAKYIPLDRPVQLVIPEEVGVRKSNRRSTAACKSFDAHLSSLDQISLVKLKLCEAFATEDVSPGSMRLFNASGVEFTRNNLTLSAYEFQCTEVLYVLAKKSDFDDYGSFAMDMFNENSGRRREGGFGGTLLTGVVRPKAAADASSSNGSVVMDLLQDSQDAAVLMETGQQANEQFDEDMRAALEASMNQS